MTQGRASYSMEPSHYAEVPRNIADEIKAKSRMQPGEPVGSQIRKTVEPLAKLPSYEASEPQNIH